MLNTTPLAAISLLVAGLCIATVPIAVGRTTALQENNNGSVLPEEFSPELRSTTLGNFAQTKHAIGAYMVYSEYTIHHSSKAGDTPFSSDNPPRINQRTLVWGASSGSGPILTAAESIPLRYEPSVIRAITPNTLVLAGWDKRSGTQLEALRLAPPQVIYNAETGSLGGINPAEILATRRLLSSALAERRFITGVVAWPGDQEAYVYVQFESSGDILRVDLEGDAAPRLVASPDAQRAANSPDAILAPGLGKFKFGLSFGRHVDGNDYLWTKDFRTPDEVFEEDHNIVTQDESNLPAMNSTPFGTYLIDSNNDGIFERVMPFTFDTSSSLIISGGSSSPWLFIN